MATMISEVYTAFKKAGVPEQEAVSAAEALASESSASKNDINQLEITFKSDVGKLTDKIARMGDNLIKMDDKLTDKIARMDDNLIKMDDKLTDKIARMDDRITRMDKELFLIKWMTGLVIAILIIPYLKQLLTLTL